MKDLTFRLRKPFLTLLSIVFGVLAIGGTASWAGTPGFQMWMKTYDGALNMDDQGNAIALDSTNSAYVAGVIYETSATGTDWVVIKYDSAGAEAWKDVRSGAGIGNDGAADVYVRNDVIYATGFGDSDPGPGANSNYVTAKMAADHTVSYVVGYNGSGNGTDVAAAVCADDTGNAYVTGGSDGGAGHGQDAVTVKYSPLGAQLWAKRYNGTAHGTDKGLDVAADGSGNVYVVGKSRGTSGNKYDAFLIKYRADGHQMWGRRFAGAAHGDDEFAKVSISQGMIFVAGTSYGGHGHGKDYVVARYDSDGARRWMRRYNGPAGRKDLLRDMATRSGRVYVTGGSDSAPSVIGMVTIKYNSAGTRLWAKRYIPPLEELGAIGKAIAVDSLGRVFVSGWTRGDIHLPYPDYLVVAYSASGTRRWAKDEEHDCQAMDVAVGNDGVYLTGTEFTTASGNDNIMTCKYVP